MSGERQRGTAGGQDDGERIRRTLAGDREAFGALYRAYRPQVYAAIARHTPEWDTREDLLQVTFMRAFCALGTFRGEAAFSTWLIQIALNVCASHRRQQRTHKAWAEEEAYRQAPCVHREGEHLDGPEEAFRRKRRRELVVRGVRSLPSRYRRAMWLRYVRGWTYGEIVGAMQVPMGTVKTWLCRSRRQLQGEFRRLGLQAM